ncbi:BppU family phage baseplate upper protein [Staphylococcus epidermidis]|uniref:BppU family phage baseplate upper protein n=1 Tax=Staphylococcus epidermidis TaxID=1282 RepID=UPI0011A80AF2|nr:BppU family phage baseplate upper protein [Staphylococcus epidermidis]
MIIKMGEVETHINPRNIDIGDIGSRFYTEDENTAFIRIRINYNGSPVDLTKTDMKPKLDLFMEDGSVFIDETIEVLIPEIGLIKYDIPSNVIKHIGKVNCKLFMDSLEHSVHVANFSFSIVDSGVEKVVSKEISLNLVKDTVKQIMSEDLTDLLDTEFKDKLTDDLENYVLSHNEEFKGEKGDKGDVGERGPKGDKGEQGIPGQDGKDGKNGLNGIDGVNGNPGPQGPPGKDGRDGVNGKDGVDGKSFTYSDFTQEQLNQLKPKGTDTGWQTLLLVNGVTQAGSSNKPMYKLITINDTEMLFIKGAISSINNKEMNFAKLPENISGKIKDYKQYTKASINSYVSIVYNITIAQSGDLKITIDPKNEVKSYDIYYIEEIVAL